MEILWKERAHQLIDELPAEATLADFLRELAELQAIERAMADREAGRLIPHDEAKAIALARFKKAA